ncbi:MAG: hypothetical protein JSS72_09590 [Armatimonadetes bacterium]|nr:hypothetical protein [Armatimonadota bacterium]
MSAAPAKASQEILRELKHFIEASVERLGTTKALPPKSFPKFHWPPHPESYDYHITPDRFTESTKLELVGETFDVRVANTEYGVFGRCEELWLESLGSTEADMLKKMAKAADPLIQRQLGIARTIGRVGRYKGPLKELPAGDLIKLLYYEDRGLAAEAKSAIETSPDWKDFTQALIAILRDDKHPHRRSAQWCALDIFEDLPRYVSSPEEEMEAVEGMLDLIWTAEDDYCRTIFKAGVVLGGHLPSKHGGPVLIECLQAPSPFGRRAAIHGLFHVVEWDSGMKGAVVKALRSMLESEREPLLKHFAERMANDIESDATDHIPEPRFEGEEW